MRTFIIASVIAIGLTGCMTEPKIEATKPWEGHCYTIEKLKDKVDNMQPLDDGESIWLLSNHTLNRLLKNSSGK